MPSPSPLNKQRPAPVPPAGYTHPPAFVPSKRFVRCAV
ncbi:predicted protein [Plenodomus lingam JN3]|uniref:Predicted protein n=1 Tax=Leptosphaeria maculans (strain JN3 / isolate v23.1.3 / race Av1-4-5-6-7-8) TaxID=985895 RepID=E5AFS4_LEPMJ|nr:predicted protein [Plenodomus lingam JN3]CBY02063.1 predicted protein [Plenodomus lingam JN3]